MTKAARGKGAKPKVSDEEQEKTPADRRAAMTWAQCLKRVFGIDIETCPACGGVRIMPKALAALAGQALACIEDREVIEKILTHLGGRGPAKSVPGNPSRGWIQAP